MAERFVDATPIICALQAEEEYGADYFYPIELLKSAPTIEAKPVVHAHWKDTEERNVAFCTNCGLAVLKMQSNVFRYCPACGAQMDENNEQKMRVDEGVKIPVISMEDLPKIAKEMEK